MLHIIFLSCFAVMILQTRFDGHILQPQQETEVGQVADVQQNTLDNMMVQAADETNYSPNCYPFRMWGSGKTTTWTSEDKFVGLLLVMGSFFVTVLLVYGAAKGYAGYLMPFFCLQVFDFCVTCLTIVGYFSYMPDMKTCLDKGTLFDQQMGFPFKNDLKSLDHDWVMLFAIIFFVLVLTLKAYFIGVVWACYKYLTNYKTGNNMIRAYEASSGEDAEMLLPPKYEDAVRMAAEQPPPPPYFPN